VQTNVFLTGQEDLMLIPVGGDSSAEAHEYSIAWNDKIVQYWIDGKLVRYAYSVCGTQSYVYHEAIVCGTKS
jgi:hypothetical protein